MKKIVLSTTIALAIAFGINNTVKANTATNEEMSTVLNDVKNIREIEVHGNVQVYLTTADTESVKVYDDYYAQNALVQEQDNVLRITSYNAKPLIVWVTVDELTKISAFDNATVSSFGKFSALDVNISLNNQATAQLDMDAINASVTLNGHASADLTGYIETAEFRHDPSARLNTSNLNAASLTETFNPRPVKHFHHTNLGSMDEVTA